MASRKALEKNGVLLRIGAILRERAAELPVLRHRTQGWCAFAALPPDDAGRSAARRGGAWTPVNVRDFETMRIGDRVRTDADGEGNIVAFRCGDDCAPIAVVRLDDGTDVEALAERAHPI